MKNIFLAALLTMMCAALVTEAVYAQATTTTSTLTSWFSWDALVEYMAVGAFFAVLHDINDGNGLLILPYETSKGNWDLGIITPAIFGAAAGFLAQAIPGANVPFLTALFPSISGSLPGIFSAVFAGYFYSKTVAVLLSALQGQAVSTTTTFNIQVTSPDGKVTWTESAAPQSRIDFLKGQGYTVQVLTT